MAIYFQRFLLRSMAILLLFQVVLSAPPPKRPGSSGGEPSDPDAKKAKTDDTPAPQQQAKKTPVSNSLLTRNVQFGNKVEKYYANFWPQKGTAPNTFFKNAPTTGLAHPTFTNAEIINYAETHFAWLQTQPIVREESFFSYEIIDTDERKSARATW